MSIVARVVLVPTGDGSESVVVDVGVVVFTFLCC